LPGQIKTGKRETGRSHDKGCHENATNPIGGRRMHEEILIGGMILKMDRSYS
jgi:hypothetical protein